MGTKHGPPFLLCLVCRSHDHRGKCVRFDRCVDTGDTFTGLDVEFATLYNEDIEGWVSNGTGLWQVSIFPHNQHFSARVCAETLDASDTV